MASVSPEATGEIGSVIPEESCLVLYFDDHYLPFNQKTIYIRVKFHIVHIFTVVP